MPADDVFTFFNRDESSRPNPPIDEGQMASLLFRLEASTLATPPHRVGTTRRDPERSIVEVEPGRTFDATLRTVNTLEVADQGLGGDFDFVRLVSDSAGVLRMGDSQTVKVRFRAAGKLGGDALPLQKAEALGGWTALRGYGFKEFRERRLLAAGHRRIRPGAAVAVRGHRVHPPGRRVRLGPHRRRRRAQLPGRRAPGRRLADR